MSSKTCEPPWIRPQEVIRSTEGLELFCTHIQKADCKAEGVLYILPPRPAACPSLETRLNSGARRVKRNRDAAVMVTQVLSLLL